MPGFGMIYPHRYDKYNFPIVILYMVTHIKYLLFIDLSFCVVSHFHQHPNNNIQELLMSVWDNTSRLAVIMIVKNIIQITIQKYWTSAKQTDDTYTTKTDYKKH